MSIRSASIRSLVLLLALSVTPYVASAQATALTRVLLDTDANNELDDQHAIAYMLFSGDVFDVEGITVNRTRGGGDVEHAGRRGGAHHRAGGTATHIPGVPRRERLVRRDRAARRRIQLRRRVGGERDHQAGEGGGRRRSRSLPVGKLTNIALALKKDPSIASKVRIVWLGSNYPEPGEYNQENDEGAVQYVLDTNVPFEIALVRYGTPSGTDHVRVTRDEIRERMPGKGPRVARAGAPAGTAASSRRSATTR